MGISVVSYTIKDMKDDKVLELLVCSAISSYHTIFFPR